MSSGRLIHLGDLAQEALIKRKFKNRGNYVAPGNELEKKVRKIWAEILILPEYMVGIHDNFFGLGGYSILAIKLTRELNKGLRINISVSTIFRYNTISKLVHYIQNNSDDRIIISKSKIKKVEEQLLSFAQERLWFIEKYEEGTNAYNISMIFKLSSNTNLEILEESIRDVVSRHEVLRTVIEEDREGRGYQLVLDDKECPLEVQRIRISNEEELHVELERSVNYIYDLSKEYPIRVSLYEISDNNKKEGKEHYLSIVVHHIAFDGWSNDIFLRDLQAYYKYHWEQARGINTGLDLQDLSIQYKDFSLWQRHYLSGERLEKQLAYWKDKLSGHETLNLVTDKLRPSQIDYVGHDIPFEISEETSLALRELAKELNVSLYSLLLSGYYLMLRSYSNQNDIVVGATVANRHYNQIEDVIGFFANTLALRTKIDSRTSIKAFIQQVGQEVIEAQLHQDLPFEKLVEELGVSKDTSRHPIFQVLFEVQSFGGMRQDHANQQKETDLGHLLEPYTGPNPYNVAKFDMSALIDDSQVTLKGNFNYAVSLYKEETISGLIETYIEILKQLAKLVNRSQQQEQTKIDDIRCLSEARYHEIVEVWNETDEDYPRDKTIHELFEEQVERTPDRVAAHDNTQSITYSELNKKANQLARYLKSKGIGIDDPVIVVMDRSIDLIISILAISKSGGVYVPTDPYAPAKRNIYICQNAKANIVITSSKFDWLDSVNSEIIILNKIEPEISTQDSSNLNVPINPLNLSYIIFTSGSTGLPKGVMLSHEGMINHMFCKIRDLYIDDSDIIAQTATQIFDISIWQLLTSLATGGKVVVFSEQVIKDPKQFIEAVSRENITILELVPAYAHSMALYMQSNNSNAFKFLKHLVITGEALKNKVCQEIFNISKEISIVNAYGPTECSDDVTHYHYKFDQHIDNNFTVIPLGKALQNLQLYILNTNLLPLPIGVIGELYVGGIILARGYYDRPDLTAEKFIANPFASEEDVKLKKNLRLYRTGDLCKYLSDGSIEYIGRTDEQVKVRGYRIELEEIESVLSSYEGIKEAAVIVKRQKDATGSSISNESLVGYYIADQGLSENEVMDYLRGKLPDYMVPTRLVHLEKFPLTVNGKLDKKALPEIESREEDNYVAPRNELERKVCEIWAEVLGLSEDKVGIHDDFFKLGGDSIVSIQLVSRLRQRVGVIVSVKDIFTYRSIERLHDNVIGKGLINDIKTIKAEQGILSGEVALLPIQEWFFESKFNKPDHWNQSFIIRMPVLDLDKLQESIAKLVNHHDSFRLRYKKAEALPLSNSPEVVTDIRSQYTQYYDINAKAEKLKILDIKTLGAAEGSQEFEDKLQEILTQWQGDFNLERGPIYSIGYIYGYADGSSRLHFAFHHLMVDTISWRLLTEDLRDIYNQKALGPKGSSYRHWVDTVEEYAKTHESEKVYWTNILADYDDNRDQINKLVVSEATRNQASLILSQEQTKQLLQESNRAYNTQVNDILLTALGLTLSEVTGNHTNYIVLEGHGREEIDGSIDITGTVGWFTTMYPVRLEVSEELGSSIKKVKESLRQIPNRGIGYGALLGYKPNSLPRISFNYLGQFDKEDNLQVQNWTIVNERSGEAVHPDNEDYNIININGLIIDGRLQFSIVSKLSESMTSKVSELFKHKLEEVIRYTANHSRSYLTASDIGYIITPEHLEKVQDSREIDGVYLANSLQQGFIYHALNQGDVDDAYLVQIIWQYNTSLEVDTLKKAWEYAQKRYPSLRLRFAWEEELVQIIDKEGCIDWRYIDLSGEQDSEVQRLKIKKIQEEDRLEHYKLDQGGLFRVYLIKQKENLYTCIWSVNHTIIDGWSVPVLLGTIHETYLRLQDKELVGLKVERSYENTQRYLQEHKDDNNAFWNKYISRIEERGDLSGLLSVTSKNKLLKVSEYNHITEPRDKILRVREETYQQLKRLSQEEGITLNAILQYVWHKVLSVYGNSNQTIVGTVVSGRNIPIDDIESAVGLYINTLPLIVDHSHKNASSIIELIKDIHREINEISSRSNVNLAKLQGGGHRLFDTLFVYENYPNPTNESRQNRINIDFKGSVEKLDYPLGAIVYEERNQLKFKVSYAGELFDDVSISNMLSVIEHLLEQIASQPYQPVQELKYLNEAQYHEIVEVWNETDEDYPRDKTIHELFEEQVERTPDSVAVVYEGSQLTYRELNNRANQLAHYLRNKHDIEADDLITLCLDRSDHMLIAILAVLKAGGAYVPVDPSYPDERIQYVLEDTNAKVVLTNAIYKERLKSLGRVEEGNRLQPEILAIDSSSLGEALSIQIPLNPEKRVSSANLAYVIYTSGTTGNPKGVLQFHSNIVRLFTATDDWYTFNNNEVWPLFHSYVFDFTVWEIWGGLIYGGKIVIPSYEVTRDLDVFYTLCQQEKVTVLNQTPSAFYQFADIAINKNIENKLTNLKYVIFGGEALNLSQIKCWFDFYGYDQPKLINMYGITETTVHVTYKPIEAIDLGESSYIGKQIPDIKAYVLDLRLAPVPLGAIGELYVGGIGLARGYLNKPDLTAERFIANPYQTREEAENGENSRLYKTGDLVRWLPDGNLEYIGRNDFQVKIRGYRIELEEIENVLSSYEGIRQSIVLVKEHVDSAGNLTGNKYLIGYYLSKIKLSEEHILAYLQSKLPDYMVPTRLVHLEKFPLTVNGKLDKKALPEIESREEDNYVAPRNELERKVCEIWAEVLGLSEDKVGIHDDFFKLGGDSIVSIQLVSRLRQRVGVIVSVKDIFTYRSIERLHDNVIGKGLINDIKTIKAEQGILSGEVALLPIQEWFFESKFNKPDHWNQSFIIRMPVLDLDKLQESIAKLVNHHDSFRLRYKKAEALPLSNSPEVVTDIRSQYTQYYDINAKAEKLKILDIKTLGAAEGSQEFEDKLQEILTQWQGDFNLERGPIYSIGYIYGYADGSSRLHFAFHHLMVDTISWRLLTEDLRDIYNQKALGPKGSSYRHWVDTVEEYAKTHESEKVYWTNILADYDDNRDQINKLVVSEATRNQASLILSQEQTKQLLQESNRAYNTQVNDILLTALGLTLSEVTGNHTNYIVLEGHGREEIDGSIDITGTVGWFTTMYPVRLEVSEELGSSIKKVKESLRQIPNRGIGYGALLGYKPNSLPRISFNYLGQFDKEDNLQVQNWTIVNERSGEAVHPDNEDYNIININGLIIDGRLQFSIVSKLSESMTSKVSELFKHKLEEVIRYTANHSRSYLTASDIGYIITPEHLEKVQDSREIDGVYLANSLQQGFIYHALNQGDVDDAYLVQIIWQYNTSLEVDTLKKAWEYAQKRYPSLRLRFAWEEELVQIIDKEGCIDWRYIDLSGEQDSEVQRLKIKKIQEEDRLEHYKLDQGGLFRVYLIKQKENLYTCIFSNHHSILDGWSIPVLLGYVHKVYLQLFYDAERVLFSVEHGYEDSQRYLQEHKDDNNAFWNKYISQLEGNSDLSGLLLNNNNRENLKINEHRHILIQREQDLIIKDKLYACLKRLAEKEGITLNTTLQYVWHKALSIYGNSNQTVVGTTVSGRNIPIDGIEGAVGLYINTLPLIVDHCVQTSKSVLEQLREVQDNINEINSRSNINLATLQKARERLFDSLFVYENYPNSASEEEHTHLKMSFIAAIEKFDYPLGVAAYEDHNKIVFKLNYAGELFDDVSISNMLSVIEHLLEQIASQPYQPVQELKYLNEAQYHEIVEVWNETDEDYPRDKTIHELFEEQVERTPDSVAVVYEGSQLTYRELNNRANQLAHYLRNKHDIEADDLITLCLDRSDHMLIAILAVLKAGGAYVPVDPSYPDERIQYVLEDTNAKVVLTNAIYKERLGNLSKNLAYRENTKPLEILAIDSSSLGEALSIQIPLNPEKRVSSANLAYTMYTSGTTGNPKGVMIDHKAFIATIDCINKIYFPYRENIKTYSMTNYVFDIFGLEYGLPLLSGGIVSIGTSEYNILDCSSYDFIQMTPSLCDLKLDNLVNTTHTKLLVGGERLNDDLLRKILNKSIHVINVYGPTETVIWSTSKEYTCAQDKKPLTVSLGKPFNNEKVYVLNSHLMPLPVGAIGELYIGGICLAKGYLNKSDLTAERFIANPYQTREEAENGENSRLYKTGDLVRWLPDGNLEYIGRNDFQVKIRGHRIELGEIEAALLKYSGVQQCVVIIKETKAIEEAANKYLVGYYVSESKLEEKSLLHHLQGKLPDYMIPSRLIHLKKLPLMISGKLDRKALPTPEFTSEHNYTAPRNELENTLCEIWAKVLGLPENKISLYDDFFRLGGNSILAIKLSSKLNEKLATKISFADLLKYQTIDRLALYITCDTENIYDLSYSVVDEGEL